MLHHSLAPIGQQPAPFAPPEPPMRRHFGRCECVKGDHTGRCESQKATSDLPLTAMIAQPRLVRRRGARLQSCCVRPSWAPASGSWVLPLVTRCLLAAALLLLPLPIAAQPAAELSQGDRTAYRDAFAAANSGDWAAAHRHGEHGQDAVLATALRWLELTRG